jgi:HD-GYP domain-containing protein (c-di-GMP phosphodiesterase class II)
MIQEKERIELIARQVISRTPEIRPHKVAAIREAVSRNSYRSDFHEISWRLLGQDDLNLVPLLSQHPYLISEHLARYKNSRYWLEAVKDALISMQARDHFTGRHSVRMTAMAFRFAQLLGLPATDLETLKIAGFLHDLGKVTINKALLTKAGTFTSHDRSLIQNHPVNGGRLVEPLDLSPPEKEIILHHHERWDGRGYPHGLAGEKIPYLCRLVALADVFEALTSDRPYRRRLPTPQALAVIENQAGTQFDPDLARKFIEMVSHLGIDRL